MKVKSRLGIIGTYDATGPRRDVPRYTIILAINVFLMRGFVCCVWMKFYMLCVAVSGHTQHNQTLPGEYTTYRQQRFREE